MCFYFYFLSLKSIYFQQTPAHNYIFVITSSYTKKKKSLSKNYSCFLFNHKYIYPGFAFFTDDHFLQNSEMTFIYRIFFVFSTPEQELKINILVRDISS